MLQHDLKIREIHGNGEDAQLFAWCLCAGWRYQSGNLHLTPMVEQFMEHLEVADVDKPD